MWRYLIWSDDKILPQRKKYCKSNLKLGLYASQARQLPSSSLVRLARCTLLRDTLRVEPESSQSGNDDRWVVISMLPIVEKHRAGRSCQRAVTFRSFILYGDLFSLCQDCCLNSATASLENKQMHIFNHSTIIIPHTIPLKWCVFGRGSMLQAVRGQAARRHHIDDDPRQATAQAWKVAITSNLIPP